MDELEGWLRRDALRIEAEVPPAVTARIREAVRREAEATSRARAAANGRLARAAGTHAGARQHTGLPLGLWAAASLCGVAAALAVVLVLPRLGSDEAARAPHPAAPVATLPPDLAREFPLVVKTADLTGPLEEELDDLKSDLDKARKRVERDLDF
ncbi:MAG TPA: hypothetical protein VF200_06595 [Woeseiaceae bacterium]